MVTNINNSIFVHEYHLSFIYTFQRLAFVNEHKQKWQLYMTFLIIYVIAGDNTFGYLVVAGSEIGSEWSVGFSTLIYQIYSEII